MKIGAFLVIAHLGQQGEKRLGNHGLCRSGDEAAGSCCLFLPLFAFAAGDCRPLADSSESFLRFRLRSIRRLSGWW